MFADMIAMSPAQLDAIFGPGTAERAQLKTLHSVVAEGRCARAIGMRLEQCPPFVDNDMSVSWRIGWYDEDQRRNPDLFAKRAEWAREDAAEDQKAEAVKREPSWKSSGRRNRTCPVCHALPGQACRSVNGKVIADEHVKRWR